MQVPVPAMLHGPAEDVKRTPRAATMANHPRRSNPSVLPIRPEPLMPMRNSVPFDQHARTFGNGHTETRAPAVASSRMSRDDDFMCLSNEQARVEPFDRNGLMNAMALRMRQCRLGCRERNRPHLQPEQESEIRFPHRGARDMRDDGQIDGRQK